MGPFASPPPVVDGTGSVIGGANVTLINDDGARHVSDHRQDTSRYRRPTIKMTLTVITAETGNGSARLAPTRRHGLRKWIWPQRHKRGTELDS